VALHRPPPADTSSARQQPLGARQALFVFGVVVSHHPALFALLHAPPPGLFRAQGASIHRVGFSGFLILSGPIVNTFDRF
jgi:hypothetical protein